MKTTTLLIGLILHFISPSLLANTDKEKELIRATLMDYMEGTANGEPERLQRAFHPNFNLYTTSDKDDLWIRSGEKYISNIQPGKKNNRKGRIISIDQEGNTATAKVEIIVPGWRVFTDYFLLVKYQERWKIVHKSYSWRPFGDEDRVASLNSELDSLFSEVDHPNHPAVTALAIHKGEIVYKKAFGSADLDHQIAATVDTKFQLAALSRHFTAFAILMLEEQGKLSLRDDIRKYLPALPEYKHTISIHHLMTMTSGLSDFWPMNDLVGLHEEDVLTQAQVMSTIGQLKPAFKPGEDYIYGHTDQILLAEIVAKASGKSFAEFMKEELFVPLGMNNTVVKDAHHQLMDNAAGSYMSTETGFRRSVINFGILGPINVYSTVDDLAKWELNLLNPTVGSEALTEKLSTPVKLNNGKYIDSWSGRFTYGQQFYHWGHGVDEIYQMGALGGHTSAMFKFPDQEFTVIILGSGMPYSGYLGMGLADHFIGDNFSDVDGHSSQNINIEDFNARKLEKFTGTYWDDRAKFSRLMEVRNDTLRYVRGDGRVSALLPVADNRFRMAERDDVFVTFIEKNGEMTVEMESATLTVFYFRKVKPVTLSSNELKSLVGSYYNPLHNIVYDITVEDDKLIAYHPKTRKITLKPVMKNVFEGDSWHFRSIQFNEEQSGFSIHTEEIKGLWFEKI